MGCGASQGNVTKPSQPLKTVETKNIAQDDKKNKDLSPVKQNEKSARDSAKNNVPTQKSTN